MILYFCRGILTIYYIITAAILQYIILEAEPYMTGEMLKMNLTEGVTPRGTPYIKAEGVYPFDAGETFSCGQCFRFDETDAEYPELYGTEKAYGGVAMGRYIKVMSPSLDTLFIEGATEADFYGIWMHYLGLDVDYACIIEKIKKIWGADSRIARASRRGCGIRIMAQEPWEALISFIISQNNNIPRIKSIIERMCRAYGEPADDGDHYSFPTAESLYNAGADALFGLRMGFRAKYVFDAAAKFFRDPRFGERVSAAASYEEADELLRSIKGVGPKVSACTLLFGFGRLEAFPVDVWIKRTAGKYFGGKIPEREDFGDLHPYAGILQQYIFNYERNCCESGDE